MPRINIYGLLCCLLHCYSCVNMYMRYAHDENFHSTSCLHHGTSRKVPPNQVFYAVSIYLPLGLVAALGRGGTSSQRWMWLQNWLSEGTMVGTKTAVVNCLRAYHLVRIHKSVRHWPVTQGKLSFQKHLFVTFLLWEQGSHSTPKISYRTG